MGVKLTDEEVHEHLEKGHTLVLATIRKSGEPFMTPLWYVYDKGSIYISTLAKSAKVGHIRRDPRVCCIVEEGEKWVDLKAVIANCDAVIIEDQDEYARIRQLLNVKYAAFRAERAKAPEATQKHYAAGSVLIKATPRPGQVRSWYNRKIRMST